MPDGNLTPNDWTRRFLTITFSSVYSCKRNTSFVILHKKKKKRSRRREIAKMMRTRLLWFSVGFASASGAIAQFVFKDLWSDRSSLASQVKSHLKWNVVVYFLYRIYRPRFDCDLCVYESLNTFIVHKCAVDGKV